MEQNSLFNALLARGMTSGEAADIEEKLRHKADLDENGLIPTSELPPQVFEHMKVVADDTARFALTTDDVQNGDVVYVDSTQLMYFVIDDTKLDQEAGYKPFAAGIAAKAIGDKNGNDITTTYATKTELSDIGSKITTNENQGYLQNYNLSPITDGTKNGSGVIAEQECYLSADTYYVSWRTTNNTGVGSITMTFYDGGGSQVGSATINNSTTRTEVSVTLSDDCESIELSNDSNVNAIVLQVMIADTANQTYVPYSPSNAYLYNEMSIIQQNIGDINTVLEGVL